MTDDLTKVTSLKLFAITLGLLRGVLLCMIARSTPGSAASTKLAPPALSMLSSSALLGFLPVLNCPRTCTCRQTVHNHEPIG